MGSCARLCFYHVSGGVRSKWKLENIAKPWECRSKPRCAKTKKSIDPKSILERILRSFYGPFAVFLGPGVVLDRIFVQKKVTRVYAGRIARIGFWGGRPFKLSQMRTPKATGPRANAKSPESKRTIERGTYHAHGLGSPVAESLFGPSIH